MLVGFQIIFRCVNERVSLIGVITALLLYFLSLVFEHLRLVHNVALEVIIVNVLIN